MSSSASDYIEALEHMFSTKGWRQYFLPKIKESREEIIEYMIGKAETMDHIHGARHAIQFIDKFYNVEKEVARLREELEEDPELRVNVVQSQ